MSYTMDTEAHWIFFPDGDDDWQQPLPQLGYRTDAFPTDREIHYFIEDSHDRCWMV